jgi:hypothetical protein
VFIGSVTPSLRTACGEAIQCPHPIPPKKAGLLSPDFKHRVKGVRGVLYFIIFQDNMKYYFQIKI